MFSRLEVLIGLPGDGADGEARFIFEYLLFSLFSFLILALMYSLGGSLSMVFLAGMLSVLHIGLLVLRNRFESRVLLVVSIAGWMLYILLSVWFAGWICGAQYLIFLWLLLLMIWAQWNGSFLFGSLLAVIVLMAAIDLYAPALQPANPAAEHWQNPVRLVHLAISLTGIMLLYRKLRLRTEFLEGEYQNAQKELETFQTKDTLTGLLNRRAILDMIEAEMVRYERTEDPFILIMADVDQLKAVNEKFGYETGDRFLKEAAVLLRENIRRQDSCARWGGGEFLFFVPTTDLEGGAVLAEKIREVVKNRIFLEESHSLQQTMTFGVHAYRGIGDAMSVLDGARKKMRRGKELGGNRVLWEDLREED